MIQHVFVYGTLKQGQCRESLWPCKPRSIHSAWVRGYLFGRSDYPALTAGTDCVLGECWSFNDASMAEVLRALDRIEGTNQPGEMDLYHRVVTEVFDLAGHCIARAYCYHYATDPLVDGFIRLTCSRNARFVCWPEPIGESGNVRQQRH